MSYGGGMFLTQFQSTRLERDATIIGNAAGNGSGVSIHAPQYEARYTISKVEFSMAHDSSDDESSMRASFKNLASDWKNQNILRWQLPLFSCPQSDRFLKNRHAIDFYGLFAKMFPAHILLYLNSY